MQITVNGKPAEVPEAITVAQLIEHLSMPGDRIAVERNLEIVRRTEWTRVRVEPGDSFEIVQFVGGGG
jgi:sulfur carrier protein